MASAIEVSRHIISLLRPEWGDLISNLRLQKLLYFSQGFHLALKGEPLFEDPIEAWDCGPVCPSAYNYFRKYGDGAIPFDESLPSECDKELTHLETETINEVYEVYGQYEGWALKNQTFLEEPWLSNRLAKVIPIDQIKTYFCQKVNFS